MALAGGEARVLLQGALLLPAVEWAHDAQSLYVSRWLNSAATHLATS